MAGRRQLCMVLWLSPDSRDATLPLDRRTASLGPRHKVQAPAHRPPTTPRWAAAAMCQPGSIPAPSVVQPSPREFPDADLSAGRSDSACYRTHHPSPVRRTHHRRSADVRISPRRRSCSKPMCSAPARRPCSDSGPPSCRPGRTGSGRPRHPRSSWTCGLRLSHP